MELFQFLGIVEKDPSEYPTTELYLTEPVNAHTGANDSGTTATPIPGHEVRTRDADIENSHEKADKAITGRPNCASESFGFASSSDARKPQIRFQHQPFVYIRPDPTKIVNTTFLTGSHLVRKLKADYDAIWHEIDRELEAELDAVFVAYYTGGDHN